MGDRIERIGGNIVTPEGDVLSEFDAIGFDPKKIRDNELIIAGMSRAVKSRSVEKVEANEAMVEITPETNYYAYWEIFDNLSSNYPDNISRIKEAIRRAESNRVAVPPEHLALFKR